MASSSGMARLALVGLLGLAALSGCSVVVGAVLGGKDSDGGVPMACLSDPDCDDSNSCTVDTCPDGRCNRSFVLDGTPCNGAGIEGMCRMGACMPCPLGGCRPTCAMVSCPPGAMCVDGECVPEGCDPVTRPCPSGDECIEGMCVERPPPGCGDGVVRVDMGEECEPPGMGDCLPNCMWRCLDASNCDDANDCTTDVCDPVLDCVWMDGVDADMDGYLMAACGGDDCKDTDPTIHPGATEACNDADDDCDSLVDNVTFMTGWYADVDGDSFGDPTMIRCGGAAADVNNGDDCYDANPNAHPYTNPGIPAPFFATDRGDGSFDYDCDGAVTKEYGPPMCALGGTNTCTGGALSCSGRDGITGPSTCGDTYALFACALCRPSGATMCLPGGPTGTTVTLGCH